MASEPDRSATSKMPYRVGLVPDSRIFSSELELASTMSNAPDCVQSAVRSSKAMVRVPLDWEVEIPLPPENVAVAVVVMLLLVEPSDSTQYW